jgi:ATP-dependent DNA helicase RecG
MLPEAENQNIEWKERWRDEYFKWICGFANAQGGTLILGKNDGGNPVGLTNTQWLLENLPNQVRNLLGIIVDINLLHEQGKALIEVVTPPYPNPISYKGKFYLRSGSTLQELNGGALQRFLLRKQGIRWDSVTVPRARIWLLSGIFVSWHNGPNVLMPMLCSWTMLLCSINCGCWRIIN